MASEITNYQCPSCTGPLHFSGKSGKLECEYCASAFDVEEIEQLYADKEAAALAAREKGQWDTTAATSCPYCGNPSVIPAQFTGMLRPDYVLPFKLDKKAATEALKNHYKGKKFLPKSFAGGNHIEEIKGVYVPFWLFDGQSDADIFFHGTIVDVKTVGDEEITTTSHYGVRRQGKVDFEKIPVDASSKMPDGHMDAIEPYSYEELKPFSTVYLPGFMAEKYNEGAEACVERADLSDQRS